MTEPLRIVLRQSWSRQFSDSNATIHAIAALGGLWRLSLAARIYAKDLARFVVPLAGAQSLPIIELLGLLHNSPVERLKRADIVRIKLGKSPDLLC
jgi:hypothetical protein